MFNFEELDDTTRRYMLSEFRSEEESGSPYPSPRLSPAGILAFPKAMEEAILRGNEETLAQALSHPAYWKAAETYVRAGITHQRRINPAKAAEFLARTEFKGRGKNKASQHQPGWLCRAGRDLNKPVLQSW